MSGECLPNCPKLQKSTACTGQQWFFVWEIKAMLLKKGPQFDFFDLKDL